MIKSLLFSISCGRELLEIIQTVSWKVIIYNSNYFRIFTCRPIEINYVNTFPFWSQCHQLTLPPSDLAHSADLVSVLVHPSDPLTAACVAASPEGVVRYWSAVTHEGSFVEISVDLKGEEAGILICLQVFIIPHLEIIQISQGDFLRKLLSLIVCCNQRCRSIFL